MATGDRRRGGQARGCPGHGAHRPRRPLGLAAGHKADQSRERPHPGAQFQVFDADGYRHTAFITDQEDADIAALELRHRRRARVEDAIRVAKDTGMRIMPFTAFANNQAWLEVSLIAQVLLR